MLQRLQVSPKKITLLTTWPRCVALFLGTFGIGLAIIYLFVLLIDPYNVLPFSLPIERPIVGLNQRYMYPNVVRSGRFDSFVIGTSTSRLLDPEILDAEFGARFANLAMDAATPWEQKTMANYFFDQAGQPKVMIVGVDSHWCSFDADRTRVTFRGFPEFLYDHSRWNDYLYLLNWPTVELAGRIVGYHLSLYPARMRFDGYQVFVPPEASYDLDKARRAIWRGSPPVLPDPALPPFQLDDATRGTLVFPALQWLDEILGRAGQGQKIIAFMPVHAAAQLAPSTEGGAVQAECKTRITQIAARHGAKVIDWLYASPLTRNDSNYWDFAHFRVPIAQRLAREMGAVIRDGRPSPDGTYRLLVK
jgi:hypothetical protein